jgi:hypothetical protein
MAVGDQGMKNNNKNNCRIGTQVQQVGGAEQTREEEDGPILGDKFCGDACSVGSATREIGRGIGRGMN